LQNTSQKSLQVVKTEIGKCKSIEAIIAGREPSFTKIRVSYGELSLKTLMGEYLIRLSMITGAELNGEQMIYLTDWIMTYYFSYTFSDFNQVIDILVSNKTYGKPTIQSITQAFIEYDNRRASMCESLRIKESQKFKYKANMADDDQMKAIYQKMIEKSKVEKPDARKQNNERIEKLIEKFDLPEHLKNYKPKYYEDENGNRIKNS